MYVKTHDLDWAIAIVTNQSDHLNRITWPRWANHNAVFLPCSDIEKIQAGIGDKVVVFLQYTSTFVAGFVIGFFINWKLTLVVATMLPIISFLAGVISKVNFDLPNFKLYRKLPVTCKSANFPLFFFLCVLRSLPHSRWKNRVRMRLQEVLQRRFSPPLEPWLPLGENRTRWRGQRVGEKQTLIHRQANRHTGRPYRRKDRHTNIWTTDRQTDRQTDRHMDHRHGQTDIWTTDTDRQTYRPQTDRKTYMHQQIATS